eukprot:COSAG02_NODE_14344_length_1282_cov_1.359256_1_plen_219_part_10
MGVGHEAEAASHHDPRRLLPYTGQYRSVTVRCSCLGPARSEAAIAGSCGQSLRRPSQRRTRPQSKSQPDQRRAADRSANAHSLPALSHEQAATRSRPASGSLALSATTQCSHGYIYGECVRVRALCVSAHRIITFHDLHEAALQVLQCNLRSCKQPGHLATVQWYTAARSSLLQSSIMPAGAVHTVAALPPRHCRRLPHVDTCVCRRLLSKLSNVFSPV